MFRVQTKCLTFLGFGKFGNRIFKYATAANKPLRSGPAQPEENPITPPGAFTSIPQPSGNAPKEPLDYVVREPLMVQVEPLKTVRDAASLRALSFDDIPGPQSLRRIAKLWSLIPVVGSQVTASTVQYLLSAGKIFGNSQLNWGKDMWFFRRLLNEYGPVVRLQGPFGGDVVILSNPDDISTIFSNEGRYPIRSSLDSIEKYRLQYRHYKQAGPYLMYGPDWERLRQVIEQPLQTSTQQQFDQIEKTCEDFITRIQHIRNTHEEVPATFLQDLHKWGMECLCTVTLNKPLGFLDPTGLSTTSQAAEILEGFMGATKAIRRCEHGLHLWKFMETPAWKSLVKNCTEIDGIFTSYIHRAQESLRQKKSGTIAVIPEEASLIENLLLKEGILPEDVLTVLLDMMLIGVNATSHSVAFLLYHLARNPRAQRKLTDEIKQHAKNITKDSLKEMKYLQACIKESLRLKPPIPVLSRVLTKDTLVHNYNIPEGTHVLIASKFSSVREENFEDAYRFKPERWLEIDSFDGNVLASIPFGHGPKACFAKNLAEMEMGLLLVKMMEKFRIEYHYGDIHSTNKLFSEPDRPLKFKFSEKTQ